MSTSPLGVTSGKGLDVVDYPQASALSDAASRVSGVIAITLVPVLIGVGAGSSLTDSLTKGYRPAMIAIGGLPAGAALVAWLFVSGERAAAPRLAPPAPDRGCALPAPDAEAAS